MKKFKANIFSFLGTAILGTLFFGLSGCVKQEASKAENVKAPLATVSASDAEIAAAQKRSTYSPEAKAHLVEALATLDEALRAPLVRQSL